MFKKISQLLFKGHRRTVKAKKNIFASFLLKGVSIVIGFLLVRVTLDYLDQVKYGVWLTLTSFLTWFTFFEIGLGNGLKNKLAESLAKEDYRLGRIYVSTTYASLLIVVLILSALFFSVNQFIDWNMIFNVEVIDPAELTAVASIVFGFFFLQFVLKLVGTVLTADQLPALASTFGPLGNAVSLLLILVVKQYSQGSLIYLSLIFSIVPVVVLIVASVYFYNSKYKNIAPSPKFVDFQYAKELLNLGVKFFLIQISALLMFQSSNILIAQFFGPEEVTSYNIAFKLFNVIMMLFNIIIMPFWAAFTEAWTKKDTIWVKNTIRNLTYVWFGMVVLSFFLFLISDLFFQFWLGKDKMETIEISNTLKVSLIVYFLTFTFGGIFNMFINGVGKLKVQLYSLLAGALMFIPLTFFFVKVLHWGIESVVIASIISNFYSPIFAPIQYYKLINNKAKGIWNE